MHAERVQGLSLQPVLRGWFEGIAEAGEEGFAVLDKENWGAEHIYRRATPPTKGQEVERGCLSPGICRELRL